MKALRADDNGSTLSDGGNLFGRVRSKTSGAIAVSFTYRYKRDGKFRDLSCGTWPSNSLKEIRQQRDAARALLERSIDPLERKRVDKLEIRVAETTRLASLQERLARPTVRELYGRWVSLELSKRKDGGSETMRGFEKDVLPAIGHMHAEDVARSHVMAILDGVLARGANRLANRLLGEMRQMFGFAHVRDIVQTDPTFRIAKKDVGGRDTERDRVLAEAEIRTLPAALAESNLLKSTIHAVWLMLATGARVGEVTLTRRGEVDLDAGTWTIPKEHAKNGREHVIYLSEFAKRHLASLLELSSHKVWVMPSRKEERPTSAKGITKQIEDRQVAHYKRAAHSKRTAHAHTLELAGGKWTPHDLRRTAGTLMGELGVDSDVIIKCLNQTQEHKVKRVYQRQIRLNDQIEAWRLLGERLDLLTDEQNFNVATMSSSRAA
ncbi:tyrosine-type recombinase/integrase [Paraburkholderia sp. Tr-20389]|nr:tyrosine-type recombinase/integrase [Paraburkholderia sp. Tr-20389]